MTSSENSSPDDGFDARYAQLPDQARALLDSWLAAEPSRPAEPPLKAAAPSPPRTPAERLLTSIWQEVLEHDEIGTADDYVELGGDSIRAIVIVAKAEAAGIRISTRDLFETRTIRSLAELGRPAETSSSDPRQLGERPGPVGDLPLTPMQQGILFHTLAAARPVYLSQVCCDLEGDLDVRTFQEAWQLTVDRHGALRSTFHWLGHDQPVQRVEASATAPWEVQDLRDRSAPDQMAQVSSYRSGVLDDGFDLTVVPLLRLALLRTGDQRHHFVLTHHHLLLDGWSQQLILSDVLTAYTTLRAGDEPELAQRPYTLPARSDEPESDECRAYWRSELEEAQWVPAPPAHSPLPVLTETLPLDPDVVNGLTAYCRRIGVTTALAIQAGWGLVLAHLHARGPHSAHPSAEPDVVIGVTVSGRARATPGSPDAAGMFINTIPMRIRCRGQELLPDWLAHLHEQRVRAAEHELDALPQIARWASAPSPASLFESIVVVENLPPLGPPGPELGFRISNVSSTIDEGYPLVLEVSQLHPGSAPFAATAPALTLRADPVRFTSEPRQRMLDGIGAYLTALSRTGSTGGGGQPPAIRELLAEIDATVDAAAASRRADLHLASDRVLMGRARRPANGDR